jgi:hypothetical protein
MIERSHQELVAKQRSGAKSGVKRSELLWMKRELGRM